MYVLIVLEHLTTSADTLVLDCWDVPFSRERIRDDEIKYMKIEIDKLNHKQTHNHENKIED